MHKYLRAVGFSDFRKRDLEILLDEIIEHPEMMRVTRDSEENEFAELSREFAPNIGITVRGIFDDNDKFEIDYYYPFLKFKSTQRKNPMQVYVMRLILE